MPKIIAKQEDWVKLGYQLFAAEGIKGIVVEKMALKLKVNKSSFYWHFKTKKDFVNEIIEHWISSETGNIIEEVECQKSPKAKFEKLVELAFKKEPHLDFILFLKRYAVKNKQIQILIDSVDSERINYTKGLLCAIGTDPQAAEVKASLFYKYLIGYHETIRYKKQPKDYLVEVKTHLNQFIIY